MSWYKDPQWIGILISLFVGFSGLLLDFLRFLKNRNKPKIEITPHPVDEYLYTIINNIGNEPIKDLEIKIKWMQSGVQQNRNIDRFYNLNDNIVTSSGHVCKFLGDGEGKIVGGLPQYSDDGKIVFNVGGSGVHSNKFIKTNIFTINNQKKAFA